VRLFAYLDPGTGTLIVQSVLGGVAGVAVLVKTKRWRFGGRQEPEISVGPSADQSASEGETLAEGDEV
jgi:hypothetical protein